LPNSARVYVILGAIARRQARWDDAILNFQRAMQIDPRDGFVFEEAGLTYGGLRRGNEAKGCFERAFALNPNEAFAGAMLASIPFYERADTRALREHVANAQHAGNANAIPMSLIDCALADRNLAAAEQALQLVPKTGTVDSTGDMAWPRDWLVGLVARDFGQADKARAAFASARGPALVTTQQLPDYPAGWMLLGMIDAGLAQKSDAIAEGKRACELLPLSKDHWDGPSYITNLAMIYAWVGEKDLALDQLEISSKIPAGVTYGDLKLLPKWDALRGQSRFDQIVASLAPK
jgi:serine/threonine-protein kinase